MHPATRARLAALALLVAAGALWYLDRGAAVVAAGVAIAIVLLVPDRATDTAVAQALHAGPVATLHDAVEALRLDGKGIFRPHGDSVVLFVPTHEAEPKDCPAFDGQTRLHQRPPVGMWLTPPGKHLFDTWRANGALHPGLEGAAATLRQALPGMGLSRDVHVERGQHIRVRHVPIVATHDDASRPWHLMGGDAVTSFIGMVLAHALQQPVQLVARDEDGQSEWRT